MVVGGLINRKDYCYSETPFYLCQLQGK